GVPDGHTSQRKQMKSTADYRSEADNSIFGRFDFLEVEAGDFLEVVDGLEGAVLLAVRDDGRGFFPEEADDALEVDLRRVVDIDGPRRLAEEIRGQVVEHLRE